MITHVVDEKNYRVACVEMLADKFWSCGQKPIYIRDLLHKKGLYALFCQK